MNKIYFFKYTMWYLLLFIVLIVLAYVFYQKISGGDDLNVSYFAIMQKSIMGANEKKTVAEWVYQINKPDGSSSDWNRRIVRALSDITDKDKFDKYYNHFDDSIGTLTPDLALNYMNIINDKFKDNNYIRNFISNYLILNKKYFNIKPNASENDIYLLLSPITKLFILFNEKADKSAKDTFIKSGVISYYENLINSGMARQLKMFDEEKTTYENNISQKNAELKAVMDVLVNFTLTVNDKIEKIKKQKYDVWLSRLKIT